MKISAGIGGIAATARSRARIRIERELALREAERRSGRDVDRNTRFGSHTERDENHPTATRGR